MNRFTAWLLIALVFTVSASVQATTKLSISEKGITLDAGSLKADLSPVVLVDGKGTNLKPVETTCADNVLQEKFQNGAQAQMAIDGMTIKITFANVPADIKKFMTGMFLPFSLIQGGQWAVTDQPLQAFPTEKPAKPFLYQGHATQFQVVDAQQNGFAIAIPQYSYMQLADNREWDWKIFYWNSFMNIYPGVASYTLNIDGAATAQQAAPKQQAAATKLSASEKGITLDAGSLKADLSPVVLIDSKGTNLKPVETTCTGNVLQEKFQNGAQAKTEIDGNLIKITFSELPNDVKKFTTSMFLPFSLIQGGQWSANNQPLQAFPAEKPAKPFLFQNNGSVFQVIDAQQNGFTINIPQYSYIQLADNREWNWKIFYWNCFVNINPGAYSYTLSVGGDTTAARQAPVKLCDQFGQSPKADYPGKVKSADELKADVAADEAYYSSLTPPARDIYGGLPGSQAKYKLQKTGFFHVEKKGTRWMLVDPEGNVFVQLGICGALSSCDDYTKVAGRNSIFEWVPNSNSEYQTAYRPNAGNQDFSFYIANLIRKYGKPYNQDEWSGRMIERYRKWGFNSAGAFCGPTPSSQAMNFAYCPSLPLGMWDGNMRAVMMSKVRGFFDPFDPRSAQEIDKLFASRLPNRANDPLILGYFLANEQGAEDIPKVIATLVDVPAKTRLVQMLQEKYGIIDKFNQAWEMHAASFDELAHSGFAATTKSAAADMQQYTELFLDTYYRTIAETFHKYDKNHMLIGNRWQPGTANNEILCRVAGKYMDVISLNYYTYGIDKSYVDRLHTWTGDKPFIFSEFHYAAPSDSGLPGGAKDVASQLERGLAYRNYLEQSLGLGYVVGFQWFSGLDQALTGRFFDTENGNIGLVSVADRPYKTMLAEMMKTNYGIYEVFFGTQKPFVYTDPRFTQAGQQGKRQTVQISRALPGLALDGTTNGWPVFPPSLIPSSRLVLGANAGTLQASYRLCYDEKNLYLMVEVQDETPMQNTHTGDGLWSGDGIELFIGTDNLDAAGPLQFGDHQLLISAGKVNGQPQWFDASVPKQYPVPLVVLPKDKGYTLEAAIPFASLGITPSNGKQLLFDIAIDDSANGSQRLRQLMWNGSARNSSDRSQWGLAKFAQ